MAAPLPAFASLDSATRKGAPVASGPLAYFPDALTLVAVLCRLGNDKHSPGQPLRWAKEKSADELDALARHLLDEIKGAPVDLEVAELGEFAHAAQIAWRALAHLQRRCDAWREAEAYADRVLAPEAAEPCGACEGAGRVPDHGFSPSEKAASTRTCLACNGHGYSPETETEPEIGPVGRELCGACDGTGRVRDPYAKASRECVACNGHGSFAV